MPARDVPPHDIAPAVFFEHWVPERVRLDAARRARLVDTVAVLEFELIGEGGGHFCVHVDEGRVVGRSGPALDPDLRVRLDVETWRALNSGDLSAPEAFLRRRVQLRGNLVLAVKLHLILGR